VGVGVGVGMGALCERVCFRGGQSGW
jgi:hypothetical protein